MGSRHSIGGKRGTLPADIHVNKIFMSISTAHSHGPWPPSTRGPFRDVKILNHHLNCIILLLAIHNESKHEPHSQKNLDLRLIFGARFIQVIDKALGLLERQVNRKHSVLLLSDRIYGERIQMFEEFLGKSKNFIQSCTDLNQASSRYGNEEKKNILI